MTQTPTVEQWAARKCAPCRDGTPPLAPERARAYLRGFPGWEPDSGAKSIRRVLLMKDFLAAVDLIRRIAEAAEAEDHHPDLHLTGFRKLAIELRTHAIGGLSDNDFILAAKIEGLPRDLKG